jgi:transposase
VGNRTHTSRKPYRTDLTDAQWALVEPRILAFENRRRPGPERTVCLREVTNTLLYQNRTGCQWDMLPTPFTVIALCTKIRSGKELDRTGRRMRRAKPCCSEPSLIVLWNRAP